MFEHKPLIMAVWQACQTMEGEKSPALPMSEHNFCNLLDENGFSCVSV
jgi:hypothetical protein